MLAPLLALAPWQDLALHAALALLISSLGFFRVVYFVSLGYAGSIAAMALLLIARSAGQGSTALLLQATLLLSYGLRLGSYLVTRERQPAFRREIAEMHQRQAGIGPGKRIAIWLGVSLLYVLMFSPALFQHWAQRANSAGTAHHGSVPTALTTWLGLSVMISGLLLEAFSDGQKSAFKKLHAARICNVGVYRWVRCPNYLGEILFWIGNFLAGLSAYAALGHWLSAAIGLVCIILIMMGSTKRLEAKQDARYGSDPDYQQYVRTVPVLFPCVPLYSLKGIRVYLE